MQAPAEERHVSAGQGAGLGTGGMGEPEGLGGTQRAPDFPLAGQPDSRSIRASR